MKTIQLTKGFVALVDDEDYEYLSQICWRKLNGYAICNTKTVPRKTASMHRVILGLTDSNVHVDHIDFNKLNNQKSNLRLCTNSENSRHRQSKRNSTSKYVGVCLSKGKWRAMISVNRKAIHVGLFSSEIDAAKARDIAVKKYYGEFANLNFKEETKCQ